MLHPHLKPNDKTMPMRYSLVQVQSEAKEARLRELDWR